MGDAPVILYIEDNADNRKLVSRVLKAAGFVVFGATDGITGLQFIARQIPDLILLDINLPIIDGYEVATQLRRQKELDNTPIVALTANVMQQDREKSAAAGCNGYIQKPIDVDSLPGQIRSYLAKKETRNEHEFRPPNDKDAS